MMRVMCTRCVLICNNTVTESLCISVYSICLKISLCGWLCMSECVILTASAALACGWSWIVGWGWCCCCWECWTHKNTGKGNQRCSFFYQKPILVQLTVKTVRVYVIEIEGLNPCQSHFIVSSAICKRHTQDQNTVPPGLRRMNEK